MTHGTRDRIAADGIERPPVSKAEILQELLALERIGVAIFGHDRRIRWAVDPLPRLADSNAIGERCDRLFEGCEPSCDPCLLGRAKAEGVVRRVVKAPIPGGGPPRFFEAVIGPLPDGDQDAEWIGLFREIEEPRGFETLLQKSVADVVRLIDTWSVPVALLAPDGRVRGWNSGAARLYGIASAEAVDRDWSMLVGEEIGVELPHPPETRTRRYEARHRSAAGAHLDVMVTRTELATAGTPTGGAFVLVADLSESKALERSLARRVGQLSILREIAEGLQSQMDLHSILRTILVGATAGQGLRFNRAFLLLADERRGEIRGRDAIGPADPEEAHRIWSELDREATGLEALLRRMEPILDDPDSRIERIVRSLHAPLEDEADFLVRALHAEGPILVRDGRVTPEDAAVEEAFLERVGVRSFAAVPLRASGRPVGLLLADNAITAREIEREDVEVLELLGIQAAFAIERARATEAIATQVASLERATREIRTHEERLVRAERLSAIGEMAARVVHEIRNPLAAIGGFARSLLRAEGTELERREAAAIIVDEVRRLEDIIREVLDFSRPSSPRPSPLPLDRLTTEAADLLRFELEEAGIGVTVEIPSSLPEVSGDRDQLFQALVNVLRNALHAMPRGGRLALRLRALPGAVELAVEDSGVGMTPEVRARVFEPFFTTKSSGTGLGLTIASQILRDHMGEIRVESREGEGTTVYLRVPIHTEG